MYRFDKAQTFSDYIKYVNDLSSLFPDTKIKYAMSVVNSFVKDYTVIRLNNNNRETIEFNVESFITHLQKIKRDRYTPFQFHFTVGASSGYLPQTLYTKTDTVNSFSYIGEKVGMKFKLFDFEFFRNRAPGDTYHFMFWDYIRTAAPKQPLVSNIHVLAYGSGLLYNILNTTSSKKFDTAIMGAGIGFTFSNALDLNFTAAIPFLNDRPFKRYFETPIYSIGFDIQFSEYFKRLGEKRRSKELNKAIVEAKQ